MIRESYESKIDEAIHKLQTANRLLQQEIANYPGPISGCDVQFNQLLSDRTRISRTMQALQTSPFVPTPRVLEQEVASDNY